MIKNLCITALATVCFYCMVGISTASEPGTPEEPIRYAGQPKIADQRFHDGQLRPAVGTHSYQVFRANKTFPTADDGSVNRYNHAPMLAYWNGRYYYEYLGSEWRRP